MSDLSGSERQFLFNVSLYTNKIVFLSPRAIYAYIV